MNTEIEGGTGPFSDRDHVAALSREAVGQARLDKVEGASRLVVASDFRPASADRRSRLSFEECFAVVAYPAYLANDYLKVAEAFVNFVVLERRE